MRRTFPSLIDGFLAAQFGGPDTAHDVGTIFERVGSISVFLEMYEALPDELIILQGADLAELLGAVGTIRVALQVYIKSRNATSLSPVGRALNRAWRQIKKLPDQVPASTNDLAFITDPAMRDMIALDMAAVAVSISAGEWKGATVIAGSCCEALLLYGLQELERRQPGVVPAAANAYGWTGRMPDPNSLIDQSWDLYKYTLLARSMGLISAETEAPLHSARGYRNLIHPAKAIRDQFPLGRGTALIGAGALDLVTSDLKKNL